VRGFVEIFVDFFADIWNTAALPFLRAPFLDFATGFVLTQVCVSVYNTTRIEATFASGPVTVTNQSKTAFYEFVGNDLRIRNPATGKTYTNLPPTIGNETLGPWSGSGAFPTVSLTFVAEEEGAAGTSAAGEINEVLDSFPGLFVSNPIALVGNDQERDDDLRTRARANVGPFSPMGPTLAYEAAARSAVRPDGTPVIINRVRLLTPPGDGTLRMIVASPTGPVDAGDLLLILEKVRALAEPIGITCFVESATPLTVTFDYTAYLRSVTTGLSSTEANALVTAALIDWFQRAPIGGWKKSIGQASGKVYADETKSIISSSAAEIFLAEISIGDLDVGNTEVPVLGVIGSTVETVAY
jgi:ribosomal protein S28E/S33